MACNLRGGIFRGGAALLCALALIGLAGCGSGDSSSSSSSSGAPSAPSISGSPVVQAQVGQAYSFTPTAKANGSNAVSFSIENKPAWATFSIADGQLSGTPTSSDIGTYANVVISVSNGTATRSLPAFTITVSQGSGGTGTATLSWVAPTTNTNGTALTDLAGYTISYGTSANSLTQSVTIANAGTTSYTLQNLSAGTWYFAIAAYTTDGSDSSLSNVVSTTID